MKYFEGRILLHVLTLFHEYKFEYKIVTLKIFPQIKFRKMKKMIAEFSLRHVRRRNRVSRIEIIYS